MKLLKKIKMSRQKIKRFEIKEKNYLKKKKLIRVYLKFTNR